MSEEARLRGALTSALVLLPGYIRSSLLDG